MTFLHMFNDTAYHKARNNTSENWINSILILICLITVKRRSSWLS